VFCLSRLDGKTIQNLLEAKRRVCLTEMENKNLLKTESEMKQEDIE